jgi:hypothetical protein
VDTGAGAPMPTLFLRLLPGEDVSRFVRYRACAVFDFNSFYWPRYFPLLAAYLSKTKGGTIREVPPIAAIA